MKDLIIPNSTSQKQHIFFMPSGSSLCPSYAKTIKPLPFTSHTQLRLTQPSPNPFQLALPHTSLNPWPPTYPYPSPIPAQY